MYKHTVITVIWALILAPACKPRRNLESRVQEVEPITMNMNNMEAQLAKQDAAGWIPVVQDVQGIFRSLGLNSDPESKIPLILVNKFNPAKERLPYPEEIMGKKPIPPEYEMFYGRLKAPRFLGVRMRGPTGQKGRRSYMIIFSQYSRTQGETYLGPNDPERGLVTGQYLFKKIKEDGAVIKIPGTIRDPAQLEKLILDKTKGLNSFFTKTGMTDMLIEKDEDRVKFEAIREKYGSKANLLTVGAILVCIVGAVLAAGLLSGYVQKWLAEKVKYVAGEGFKGRFLSFILTILVAVIGFFLIFLAFKNFQEAGYNKGMAQAFKEKVELLHRQFGTLAPQ